MRPTRSWAGRISRRARSWTRAQIGTITAGAAAVQNHGTEGWHPNPDFFFLPGAGPMLDLGPYYVANLINLLGPVKRVGALTSSAKPTRTIGSGARKGETIPVKTPTNIHALLEFHHGATVQLSTSWDVWSHRRNHFELYGTEGTLYVPDPNFFGGTVEVARPGRRDQHGRAVGSPVRQGQPGHPAWRLANYRTAGLADMAHGAYGRPRPPLLLERTLHGVDVMTSILKSGETGQFVTLTTTCTRPAALGIEEARRLAALNPAAGKIFRRKIVLVLCDRPCSSGAIFMRRMNRGAP